MTQIQQPDLIIKPTHRALWYEDGVLKRVLEAGRYEMPRKPLFGQALQVDVVRVDMRERDLTIKGQEILTADKVAIRVSIIVRFKVEDAVAAVQAVESYEDRLYSDVQLAARRSLAAMKLEEILVNRNELSESILAEVSESANGYGVKVIRADVKDLIFPGNLEAIMNRVLTAERVAESQLIEARARADVERIHAESAALVSRLDSEADAEAKRIATEAEIRDLREREQAASAYTQHPALLRLLELHTLRELARTANARIYVSFDQHTELPNGRHDE
jgi:regulator of protease activity HflC (stomatin/prohibitin superfamily)